MALLILLPTAARARVVATDLLRARLSCALLYFPRFSLTLRRTLQRDACLLKDRALQIGLNLHVHCMLGVLKKAVSNLVIDGTQQVLE